MTSLKTMTSTMLWKIVNIMTYLQMKMAASRTEMTTTRLETMTMTMLWKMSWTLSRLLMTGRLLVSQSPVQKAERGVSRKGGGGGAGRSNRGGGQPVSRSCWIRCSTSSSSIISNREEDHTLCTHLLLSPWSPDN